MEPLYVKAGDVFFTHSTTLLGKLIRWGELDKGEKDASWANHTGVVVEDGWIGATDPNAVPAVVIEALWYTRKGPLVLKDTEVRVFRPVPPYSEGELYHLTTTAETYVGNKYGWWKLLFQLADKSIFGGKKILTTSLHRDDRPICSYLAAKVNQIAQSKDRIVNRVRAHVDHGDNGSAYYAFGVPPQAADPDSMMDYCLDHPYEWFEVINPPTPPETIAEEAIQRTVARIAEVDSKS